LTAFEGMLKVGDRQQNIYNLLGSKTVLRLVSAGRHARKSDLTRPAAAENTHKLQVFLWESLGPVPICLKEELIALVTECMGSPFLLDEQASQWLEDKLRTLCQHAFHGPRLCPIGDTIFPDDSVRAHGRSSWCLAVAGEHYDEWVCELFEVSSSPGMFGHLVLEVSAHGVSESVFTQGVSGIASTVRAMRRLLDDTFEEVATGDANSSTGTDVWTRQRQEDDATTRRCMELWLRQSSKKHQLHRRLRVAIGLITQASLADHTAVRICLWCAAIEALVCKKGGDTVSAAFTSNTTTLLEPRATMRIPAMDEVKKLYAARCDLIHGSNVDENPESSWMAARLAAGVFRATMQWMRFHDTIEQQATADDAFFDAIRVADKTGQPMAGISTGLEKCLPGFLKWGKTSEGTSATAF